MTKMNQREREAFEEVLRADLKAIQSAFAEQIKTFWQNSRAIIEQELGYDKLIKERENLKHEQAKINQRLHEIEEKLKSEPLRVEQVVEYGGSVGTWDRAEGANFHGIPLSSQFDYKVAKYIQTHVNIDVPAKLILDLHRSAMRELAMSGTFDKAKEVYENFYALDFRKYGVDIAPRLGEFKENKILLEQTQQTQQTLALGKPIDLPKLRDEREENKNE